MKFTKQCTLIIMFMVLLSSNTQAQMQGDAGLLNLNVTYSTGSSAVTENRLEGWGFGAAYEKVSWDNKYSLGFAMGWIASTEDSSRFNADKPGHGLPGDSGVRTLNIDTFPFYAYGKYFFGSPTIRAYLGLGLGAYITNVEVCSNLVCGKLSGGGFALGVPLGVYCFVSKSVFFNANYFFNWLSDSPFDNNIAHVFNLGIGFQFN
jgi:hypothetical protein